MRVAGSGDGARTAGIDVRKDGAVHLTHVHVCAAGHSEIVKMLCLRDNTIRLVLVTDDE